MRLEGKIFVTGGAGFLGRALIRKAQKEKWPCSFTIYSRDEEKQWNLQNEYGSHIQCFLGDVRDYQSLTALMPQHDLVIHAAAVKFVPEAERNVWETAKVNIDGSKNVVRAAAWCNVPKVIAISTDKACITWGGRITLSDGRKEYIGKLAREGAEKDILSLTEGGLAHRKATKWYDRQYSGPLIRVSYSRARLAGGFRSGAWFTPNHLILTKSGWVEAENLTSRSKVATEDVAPNSLQQQLLVGTLLGDASIGKQNASGRTYLVLGHCRQDEWLRLKASALRGVDFGPYYQDSDKCLSISSHQGAYWGELEDSFYLDRKKIVPFDLLEKHFSPLLLTSWYLDDGCLLKNNGGSRPQASLATCGFTREETERLADFFTLRGMRAYVGRVRATGKYSGEYWQVVFTVEGAQRLFEVIGSYVPPSMRYKLPEWAQPYRSENWELGTADTYFGRAILERKQSREHVYCVDVPETQNFVVSGIVAHNCLPVNVYGMTKALMERLMAEANRWREQTIYGCVRYGNVVGSTGSIIPVFKKQLEQRGKVLVTDDRMTRFWLSVDEAIDLICLAQNEMADSPGSVWVPQCGAMRIIDLARLIAGEAPVEVTGIRPGEKLNEALIHHQESTRVEDKNGYYVLHPQNVAQKRQEGWTYSSHNPSSWISPERMAEMIADAGEV